MMKSTPISWNFVRPRDMSCGDNRMHGITGGRNHKVGFVTTLRFQCTYAPMMTSSNGNIFRVTGPLCREFTGPGEFPAQRPVTWSFDIFFDLRPNKRLSKQSWGWWFLTLLCPLWRHSNASSWAANWTPGTRVSWRDILLRVYALMMTSSNGNIFRVTGPLCGEFTGPGEFPTQRPVTRSFDVYFDLRLNKRLCKQSWGWWFETLLCPLWRHSNASSWAANWTPGTRVSWRDILLRVLPKCCWDITTSATSLCHGPLARYVKLRVAHVPRMPGTLPPPPRVSDPDMLHGTCVTHVPWCMPGSLICGFLWSRWRGKRSRHSGACATRDFTYLAKGPWYMSCWLYHYSCSRPVCFTQLASAGGIFHNVINDICLSSNHNNFYVIRSHQLQADWRVLDLPPAVWCW